MQHQEAHPCAWSAGRRYEPQGNTFEFVPAKQQPVVTSVEAGGATRCLSDGVAGEETVA